MTVNSVIIQLKFKFCSHMISAVELKSQINALKHFYFITLNTPPLQIHLKQAFSSIYLHFKMHYAFCIWFSWERFQTEQNNGSDVCCLNGPLFQMPIMIQLKTHLFFVIYCCQKEQNLEVVIQPLLCNRHETEERNKRQGGKQ